MVKNVHLNMPIPDFVTTFVWKHQVSTFSTGKKASPTTSNKTCLQIRMIVEYLIANTKSISEVDNPLVVVL